MKRAIIVTGLPASGKSTLGRNLAAGLGFVCLDKDDFLEDLYDQHGVSTWQDRTALSRQSDDLFRDAAQHAGSAVLISHWRALGADGGSGTACDWVAQKYDRLVEVCCRCPPQQALAWFLARSRHPGHLDAQRDPQDLARRFADWDEVFPLGLGPVVSVSTDAAVDIKLVLEQVRAALYAP